MITIKHGDGNHSVEFLNQTVKNGALEPIEKRLPKTLNYQLTQRTRLQAALPFMISAAILLGVALWLGAFILQLIFIFIGLAWVFQTLLSRLISPTETRIWTMPENFEMTTEKN